MRTRVTFRLPEGREVTAGHGDLVGRLASAAVPIDDARISEAHALVSLRGTDLCLLALRGRFAVDGRPTDRVVLLPGMRIHLARRVALEVVEVVIPDAVLALEGPGLPTQMLPNTGSLVLVPETRLEGRYVSGAAATFWTIGSAWRYRIGDGPAQPLAPGDRLVVGERVFEARLVRTQKASSDATLREGRLAAPLQLVCRFDHVTITRRDQGVVTLAGIQARIVSELAEIADPVAWHAVAGGIWDGDRDTMRRKWDMALARLRRKLRDAGIRQDLVLPDGNGNVQLLLYADDRCEVRS
jgi:hypothetical protein